jgi:hypothetical protein
MHTRPANTIGPTHDGERLTLGALARPLSCLAWLVGVVGMAGGIALGWHCNDDLIYFYHSYLLNYCFFLSISLGALFSVALDHACRAGWNVNLRRLAEIMAANIPTLTFLFLPIIVPVLLGSHGLYGWNSRSAIAGDALLGHKAAYLNAGFFGVRCVAYFAVWGFLARFYLTRSLEQDETRDPALTLRMERLSPLALVLFAVTVTFASFDWLMSLTPHWFSTIYGVYFFSGAVVAFFAAIILAAVGLQLSGRLRRSISIEHYHDLGKLLFAFVIFWGYIAFSQYLLMWYANMPEETGWYLTRQSGLWLWVSLVLLFGNLLIPFCGLLSRQAKRRKWSLCFWSVWLLVMHWIDLYYLVMPDMKLTTSVPPSGPLLGATNICLFLGIGGLYLAGLLHTAGQRPLLPVADPRLQESMAFENT